MNTDDFDARMRRFEYFHELRSEPNTWLVLRLDGRGFTKFTARAGFEKPFDSRFQEYMRLTTKALLQELQGIYAFTESDEISLLFPPHWDFFDREVEKIVSISAGIASSHFSLASRHAVQFDSRIWVGIDQEHVIDYFRWRQEDAKRCALNGWCHWTLIKEGKSPAEAMHLLHGQANAYKLELLAQRNIHFNELPVWQRYGTGIRWETYDKVGYNPQTASNVTTQRRRLVLDEQLPVGADYALYIEQIMKEYYEDYVLL